MNLRVKSRTILLLFIALTVITVSAQSKVTDKKTVKHKKIVAKKHKKKHYKVVTLTFPFYPADGTIPDKLWIGDSVPVEQPNNTIDTSRIYDKVDEPAQFPGGMSALYEFIGKNLTYPPSARDASIQGKVIVKFVIERNGTISNIGILKSLDTDLDKEAKRVVSIMPMPNWIPAKIKNVPVRSFCYLPIMFKLEE